MSEKTIGFFVGISGIIIGAIGAGCAAHAMNQADKCRRIIDESGRRIRDLSQVEIDRHIVDRLVRESVTEQAKKAVHSARKNIEDEMTADLRNKVRDIIGDKTKEINDKVAEQLAKQMAQTDTDDIIRDVTSATTEKLIDKLSDDLDNEVGKIGKIYKGIAAMMQ